ncbi:MAG: hypothetical protein JNM19_01670 [Chitinophagaceae bacterium]|nr:hypothetical protein [Chitinophagaceae bacterium]
MKRNLLLPLLIATLFISSCSKNFEDRLIGSWRLDDAYRRVFLGRDHFETGYESGVFTLFENGDASYVSSTDTLNGYWRSDRYNNNYYNGGTGQWENRSLKYLRLYLRNFTQNKFIDWEFDDFNFRNNWREIRAEQYSLGGDRVYEFVRQ